MDQLTNLTDLINAGGVTAFVLVLAYGLYRGLLTARIISKLDRKRSFVIVLVLLVGSFMTTIFIAGEEETNRSNTDISDLKVTKGSKVCTDGSETSIDSTEVAEDSVISIGGDC